MPLAATTYYFASRHELIEEALRHAAEQEIARLEREATRLAEVPPTPAALAAALAGLVDRVLRRERVLTVAQYELCLEAARDPSLRAEARRWYDVYRELMQPVVAAAGSPDPERDAHLLVGMLDGLALEQLAAPRRRWAEEELQPAIERFLRLVAP